MPYSLDWDVVPPDAVTTGDGLAARVSLPPLPFDLDTLDWPPLPGDHLEKMPPQIPLNCGGPRRRNPPRRCEDPDLEDLSPLLLPPPAMDGELEEEEFQFHSDEEESPRATTEVMRDPAKGLTACPVLCAMTLSNCVVKVNPKNNVKNPSPRCAQPSLGIPGASQGCTSDSISKSCRPSRLAPARRLVPRDMGWLASDRGRGQDFKTEKGGRGGRAFLRSMQTCQQVQKINAPKQSKRKN